MKKNMGTIDRFVRAIVACAVIGLYFANVISGTVAIALLVVSGIFILTSLISFCPIYTFLGLSTQEKK